eukprot:Ihof_evm4s394 gene=Ihof_evmTU4s394
MMEQTSTLTAGKRLDCDSDMAEEERPTKKRDPFYHLGNLTPEHMKALRILHSVVFPVRYSAKFYNSLLSLDELVKLAFVGDSVVGAICCRPEECADNSEGPTGPPSHTTLSPHVPCLTTTNSTTSITSTTSTTSITNDCLAFSTLTALNNQAPTRLSFNRDPRVVFKERAIDVETQAENSPPHPTRPTQCALTESSKNSNTSKIEPQPESGRIEPVHKGKNIKVYIMTLGCQARYRHMGIGSTLLRHIIDYCRKSGNISQIYLHVHVSNE